jgi:endogenous inhibitor of DNA gyrase (YacG/DUF329 family)
MHPSKAEGPGASNAHGAHRGDLLGRRIDAEAITQRVLLQHDCAPAVQAAGPTRECARCGRVFAPQRSTARYCNSRCRLIAHRSASAEPPATANRKAADARVSVSSHPGTYHPPSSASETLTPQQPRASKAPSKLDPRIVPDAKWPGMYRVRRPDGTLSDLVNLTRAKDALAGMRGQP